MEGKGKKGDGWVGTDRKEREMNNYTKVLSMRVQD